MLPRKIEFEITQQDILSSITGLFVLPYHHKDMKERCVGALCTKRTLQEFSRDQNFKVSYSKDLVTSRIMEGKPGKYWQKNVSAKRIDAQFDSAFEQALEKFGNPNTWLPKQVKVKEFLLKRTKHLVGEAFVLTRLDPKEPIHHHKRKRGGGIRRSTSVRRDDIIKAMMNHAADV